MTLYNKETWDWDLWVFSVIVKSSRTFIWSSNAHLRLVAVPLRPPRPDGTEPRRGPPAPRREPRWRGVPAVEPCLLPQQDARRQRPADVRHSGQGLVILRQNGSPRGRNSELFLITFSKNHLNLKVETTAWPPMSSSNNQYLLLDNVPVLDRSEDYENNMNFWRQLFPC